jgi:hypothetical protein
MEYLADLILAGGPTLAMRQVGELDRGAAHRTLREGAGRRLYKARRDLDGGRQARVQLGEDGGHSSAGQSRPA